MSSEWIFAEGHHFQLVNKPFYWYKHIISLEAFFRVIISKCQNNLICHLGLYSHVYFTASSVLHCALCVKQLYKKTPLKSLQLSSNNKKTIEIKTLLLPGKEQ